MLSNYSKSELVAAGRQMKIAMGDYARASKEELISRLAGREAEAEAILDGTAQSLVSIQPAAPTAVAPVVKWVPPSYDHIKPIKKVSAAEVFGSKAGALKKIMVDVWNDPEAPAVNKSYRFDPKHLEDALTAVNRGRNVWLAGPAGTGKTEFVKQLCARMGRAFIRVQFDASLEAYHIMGGERVKAASTVWQDGLVSDAYRRPGAVVLLDEVGFARSEYTSSLHAALEPDGVITITETGERIHKAPGVVFFAADNSNGRGDSTGAYVGLREQNNAFISRFAKTLEFSYMKPDEEAEVVVANVPEATPQLARMVVDFIGICRAKAEAGTLETPPTMREAFYLTEALVDGVAPRRAFETTVVNRSPVDVQEILQQLWTANVADSMVDDAVAGTAVVLKTLAPAATQADKETNPF